jgi:hypothetical protein
VPAENVRESQLAMLRPLLTISQGGRGLAMLAKAIALAGTPGAVDDAEDISGSLICYCVREAIDSIFPKLGDPQIRQASERLVGRWHRVSTQPDQDVAAALHEDFEALSRAVKAATAGFLPRVSMFLGVLHPGIAADISLPAMATLRDLNKASNAGLHGSTTHDEAIELLDQLLARLIDLVAPLAVTVKQYQELIDAGDFRGVADLLAGNSDPRIRVYIFERVRDPLLARELDLVELLPSPSNWFAYDYVRHLAAEQPAAFRYLVDRIPQQLMTAQVASQFLTCATFAGASAANEVDRLSKHAGSHSRVDLVARWLRSNVEDVPEGKWWRILTWLVALLDTSRSSRTPHGFAEVIEVATTKLPEVNRTNRSRFAAAVFAALARLDAEAPYVLRIHFDNPHLRALSASDLLINTAAHMLAFSHAQGERMDLSSLEEYSREALERAAVAPAIAMAAPEISRRIAEQALASVIRRIAGEGWPDPDEHDTLKAILPLVSPATLARVDAVLGEPPTTKQLQHDLDNAAEVRAEWFRLGQWAAHLPEEVRSQRWVDALRASTEHGITFGPLPRSSPLAEPRAHDSPLGDIDVAETSVSAFVDRLNAAVAVAEAADPRFAMSLGETVTAHVSAHRDAWADDHHSIREIHDLWVRRMIISALKNEANDSSRLSWEQLQYLWSDLATETTSLKAAGVDQLKAASSQLAGEILEHLRHRVKERPRTTADVDWWTSDVLPPVLLMLAWIGDSEPDIGMAALFSIRGEATRLLVILSSPIDNNTDRDAALGRALDALAAATASDSAFASSVGHWARWLIRRAPDWWERHSDRLVGVTSVPEVREALLTANFDSENFALDLLGMDLNLLNSYAIAETENAAYPALTAVLFDVVPIEAIEQATWSAIFRDEHSAEKALHYLFPDQALDDLGAVRRFAMLRSLAADAARAAAIWRSMDVLAGSPDVSDDDLFAFAAELASANRGAPMSTFYLADRFVRSLTKPAAVQVLESMCSGNLGGDRAMAQYDLRSLNEWFQREGPSLPADLRTRVRHALFEIGFPESAS